ncbi:hypothetical protein ACFQ0B_21520 [Nonomuraea thailandensis]
MLPQLALAVIRPLPTIWEPLLTTRSGPAAATLMRTLSRAWSAQPDRTAVARTVPRTTDGVSASTRHACWAVAS